MLDTKENLKGRIDDVADKGWTQARSTAKPEGAGGIVDAVKERVQAVATGASDLAGIAKDTAQEWASSVGGAAVYAKNATRDVASAAAEKVGEIGQDLTELIRRRPLQSLLAGLGVGFAVGFLVAHVVRRS
jgi:ElaB/YqjD/DUF883 family membrane-anchored ribosome-binding protein